MDTLKLFQHFVVGSARCVIRGSQSYYIWPAGLSLLIVAGGEIVTGGAET